MEPLIKKHPLIKRETASQHTFFQSSIRGASLYEQYTLFLPPSLSSPSILRVFIATPRTSSGMFLTLRKCCTTRDSQQLSTSLLTRYKHPLLLILSVLLLVSNGTFSASIISWRQLLSFMQLKTLMEDGGSPTTTGLLSFSLSWFSLVPRPCNCLRKRDVHQRN